MVQPIAILLNRALTHSKVNCAVAIPSRYCDRYNRRPACSAGYELEAPLTVAFVETGRYGVGSRRRASRLMKPPELSPSLRTTVHDGSACSRGESQAVPVGKWLVQGVGAAHKPILQITCELRVCLRRCCRVQQSMLLKLSLAECRKAKTDTFSTSEWMSEA